jgi:hypothetical protein
MILYLKGPKNSTHLPKSVAFLYTSNEQIEKEYRKTIPFTTALK